jgi:hypothetical protein
VTRHDRLSRDDYQAAMASLDWQDRRHVELSSKRGEHLDNPAHAALAAERARRASARLYWGLASGPIAAFLLVSALDTGSTWRLWFGGFWTLLFLIVVWTIASYQRGRSRHLANADFDALREVAQTHRTTYRRRD